jgi:hypothetical protein
MSEEIYIPKAGDLVEYVDENGHKHNAIVSACHGNEANVWEKEDGTKVLPVINVLYVSADETKTDPYGRQIERASSVQHVAGTTAKGRFWRPVQINVI